MGDLLTEIAIKNAKPADKAYQLKDTHGLYLEVPPTGNKRWRIRYSFDGRENRLSLGIYPTISLKQARAECAKIRVMIAQKINPSVERKNERSERDSERKRLKEHKLLELQQRECNERTFNIVKNEWTNFYAVSESVKKDTIYRIDRDIAPIIGDIAISKITEIDIKKVIDTVWSRGALEQSRRHLQILKRIFRYAKQSQYIENNPCSDFAGYLPVERKKTKKGFRAIVEPQHIPKTMQQIDAFDGTFVVQCALKLTPFLFLRPGELRKLQWEEFDRERRQLRISGRRMKNLPDNEIFVVPLADYPLNLFDIVRPYSCQSRYIFPGLRDQNKPLSEGAVLSALKKLGVNSTAHGFRKTASTILNEMKFNADAIERQLSHVEKDVIRGTYNFAEYLPERTVIMAVWADYLLAQKNGLIFDLAEAKSRHEANLPDFIKKGNY